MDTVKVEQVIICTKARRGDGKNLPIRCVTEVCDFNGNLIAENDPNKYTIEEINQFALMFLPKNMGIEEIQRTVREYFLK